jgi:TetR/AcrR family transcriptional regulator
LVKTLGLSKSIPMKPDRAADSAPETAKQRLMAEALIAFARDGFDGASTRDIAAAAGVNHSLIPYHFGSKDGLWRETMGGLLDVFHDNLQERVRLAGATSAADQLRSLIRSFVLFCAERPEFHRVMTAGWARQDERIRWLGEAHVRRVSEAVIRLIAGAQKEGAIAPGDPVRIHYAIIGVAVTAFAMAPEYKMLCGRDPRTPEGIEETVRILERLVFQP